MTKQSAVEVGLLRDEFPYVRFGAGTSRLVVLTGLALDNRPPSPIVARTYSHGFRRLAAGHTLFIVQRRRGLPAGASMRDIAADYAELLDELGPVRLMGLSTGGLVAQQFALDHPALVERLILVVTGARLTSRGQDICRRWHKLATAQQWRRLRGELAAAAIDGAVAQRMAKIFGSLAGRTPSPTEAADFLITVDADLAHNTTARLGQLARPVLVVGGSDDPFFPEPNLRETAAAIPGSTLRIYPGLGHGLPKKAGRQLQDDVSAFLAM